MNSGSKRRGRSSRPDEKYSTACRAVAKATAAMSARIVPSGSFEEMRCEHAARISAERPSRGGRAIMGPGHGTEHTKVEIRRDRSTPLALRLHQR